RGLLAVPRRRLAPPGGPQGLCRSLARKRISVRDPPHGDPVDRSHSRIEERSRLGPPERPPYGGARSSLPLRLSDRPREGSVRLPPPHLRDLDREKPDRAAAGLLPAHRSDPDPVADRASLVPPVDSSMALPVPLARLPPAHRAVLPGVPQSRSRRTGERALCMDSAGGVRSF